MVMLMAYTQEWDDKDNTELLSEWLNDEVWLIMEGLAPAGIYFGAMVRALDFGNSGQTCPTRMGCCECRMDRRQARAGYGNPARCDLPIRTQHESE